jgi:hypothetical protein
MFLGEAFLDVDTPSMTIASSSFGVTTGTFGVLLKAEIARFAE